MKTTSYLTLLLMVLMLASCKPKQVIHDKYITAIDSTAISTLNEALQHQLIENSKLKTALERTREENTRLSNEVLSHTINYDTAGTVDTTTGKYPIASETTTSNKSVLDRAIKEHQTQVQEYEREIKTLVQRNSNLQYQVEALKEIEKELKSKTTPAFHFKSFLAGIVVGFIIMIALLIFLKTR